MRHSSLWPQYPPLPASVRSRTADLLATSTRLVATAVLVVHEVRSERHRRWSDPEFILSRYAIAGGREQPSEQSIRDSIRKRLMSGDLKATDGMIVKARSDNGTCSACEGEIAPAEATTLGYLYRDGVYHGFHSRCVVLWEEERRANLAHAHTNAPRL